MHLEYEQKTAYADTTYAQPGMDAKPGASKSLEEGLARLSGELDGLEQKLTPVLRDLSEKASAEPDRMPSSHLAGQAMRLHALCGRLAVVNSRIDL